MMSPLAPSVRLPRPCPERWAAVTPTPTLAAQPAAAPLPPVLTPVAEPVPSGAAVAEVRGVVTEAQTGNPLPGTMVLLMGTAIGTATDAAGAFVLRLPAAARTVQLRFAAIGYASQEETVAAPDSLTVALATDTHLMGEVVVVGAYKAVRPWPWHPRRLFNWLRGSRP